MRTNKLIPLPLLLLPVLVLLAAFPAAAEERPQIEYPFELSLAASATKPSLGEDVVFTATLSTDRQEGVPLRQLLFDDRSMCLEVTYKEFPWRYTRWRGKRERPAPIPRTELTPAEPQTEQIPVLFPEVGVYEITALYAGWSHQRARSNTVTIEVQPVDGNERMLVRIAVTAGDASGSYTAELYPDCAMGTALNFLRLASDGFYDGTKFHRILSDLMSQGGDPNTRDDDPDNDGTGSPGYDIAAEFDVQRFKNAPHVVGALSMARLPHPLDSANCQFFVCSRRGRTLDDQYSCFGKVIEGIEWAETVNKVPTKMGPNDLSGKPSVPMIPVVIDQVSVLLGPPAAAEDGGQER